MQWERGTTNAYIRFGPFVDDLEDMFEARTRTDRMLSDLKWPETEVLPDQLSTKEGFTLRLYQFRAQVSKWRALCVAALILIAEKGNSAWDLWVYRLVEMIWGLRGRCCNLGEQ